MAKHIISILLLLFYTVLIKGQSNISGRVVDSTNKPISFASVVVLQDNVNISGTTSDEKGNFNVRYTFKVGTAYSLKVSMLGYQIFTKNFIYPDTSFLQSIVLIADKSLLQSITVTSTKPLISRKADRYIINVETSFLANGNSGLEVLQKSPGIWVDNNGSIHIKGNQPVAVMINDVLQRMSQDQLQEYLKTLKSEDISRIEVISNPPSAFEAEGVGGIVHIILKKAKKDGLNGSVNSQYRQQASKPYYGIGASLDYKRKKLYLFGNYSANRDIKPIAETSQIIYYSSRIYKNSSDRIDDYARSQYRIGTAYDITTNQYISLQHTRTHNQLEQDFFTDVNYTINTQKTTGINISNKLRNIGFSSTTLNYAYKIDSTNSSLKILGDYSSNRKAETTDFIELYSDVNKNTIYKNDAPNATKVYSIQADYTKAFKSKTEIKAGIKYVSINRDNQLTRQDSLNNNWVVNTAKSDHFIYAENLLMFYASTEKTMHQTNVQLGLRAEQTYSNGNSISSNQQFIKHYFGLFPSVFITHTLNEKKGNSIYINYSRRLTRPTLSDLNPAKLQYSNNTVLSGNPDLLPQFTHNIELGTTLFNKFMASVYLTKTTNVITLVALSDTNNFIEYNSQNLNNSTEVGININAPFTIVKGWQTNNSITANNLAYTYNHQHMQQSSIYLRSVHTINLKNIVDIDAIISYRSATKYANLASPSSFYFDMGLTKKVLKKQGTLRLYFTDIVNTIFEKEITDESTVYIDFYRKRPSRTASISFNYNFSFGKKFNNKKLEQGNNEERNRIGN